MPIVLALVAACACLLALAASAGAEIIYGHGRAPGEELIAMNDDGGGAHVLLTPAQIPGSPVMIHLAEPNVAPSGTTLAFVAETFANHEINGPPDDCGANCAGIYTLAGGVLTRLSEPPAPLTSASTADGDPAVTADGRVVFETIAINYGKNCIPECEVTNTSSGLFVRPFGGGAAQPWMTPDSRALGDAADPANGGLIAYTLSSGTLEVVNQQGIPTATIAAPHGERPAFSSDGSQVAYINTQFKNEGSGAGIYVVPASGGSPREVLADPTPPEEHSVTPHTFGQITWVGPSELVFSAILGKLENIYSLPAHCLTGPACTIAEATKLTSDATETEPDSYPTWTSATVAGPSATPPSGGAPVVAMSTTGTSSVAHAKTKGRTASLTITCSGGAGTSCADSLTLSVLETLRSGRLVAVAAKAKTKKRIVTLGRVSLTIPGGQTKTVSIPLNASGRGLLAHRHSLHVKLAVAQTIAGKHVVVKTLTVTFTVPSHAKSHK